MVATLLIVIGCILAPLSVVAVWTKNLVTDTDRYVATVAPLASDPAIQSAVADKITAEIFARLDVVGVTNQAVDALAERGLPPLVANQLHALSQPLANGVQSFVRDEVGKVVASDTFVDAWLTANRAAHSALVAALTGQTGEGVTIENDTVSINLGPFIQEVKQRLIDRGFELASRIPDVNPSFVLVQSDYIAQARAAFNLLNAIGNWLPVVALAFLALGVYIAKDHRRALMGAGLGLAGSMLVLGLALAFFRMIYLNELPLGVLTRDAAAAFYDTLVRFLRVGLRTVLVFGLVIALAGFFTGRSHIALRHAACHRRRHSRSSASTSAWVGAGIAYSVREQRRGPDERTRSAVPMVIVRPSRAATKIRTTFEMTSLQKWGRLTLPVRHRPSGNLLPCRRPLRARRARRLEGHAGSTSTPQGSPEHPRPHPNPGLEADSAWKPVLRSGRPSAKPAGHSVGHSSRYNISVTRPYHLDGVPDLSSKNGILGDAIDGCGSTSNP